MHLLTSDVVPEFYVNNTQIHNNTQHGIFLENVRNKAVINASSLSYNGYGAGLRVYGGAGTLLSAVVITLYQQIPSNYDNHFYQKAFFHFHIVMHNIGF